MRACTCRGGCCWACADSFLSPPGFQGWWSPFGPVRGRKRDLQTCWEASSPLAAEFCCCNRLSIFSVSRNAEAWRGATPVAEQASKFRGEDAHRGSCRDVWKRLELETEAPPMMNLPCRVMRESPAGINAKSVKISSDGSGLRDGRGVRVVGIRHAVAERMTGTTDLRTRPLPKNGDADGSVTLMSERRPECRSTPRFHARPCSLGTISASGGHYHTSTWSRSEVGCAAVALGRKHCNRQGAVFGRNTNCTAAEGRHLRGSAVLVWERDTAPDLRSSPRRKTQN